MVNIYLIDYYGENNNGLTAYVNEMRKHLPRFHELCFHHIWVNTAKKDFQKKIDDRGVFHYYIPKDISMPNDISNHDVLATNFLVKETVGKSNIIFHFNWIYHSPFAILLKQKIKCKTILTKHCIPWRDLITNNYPVFYKLHKRLCSNKDNKRTIHPALIREYLCYNAVDHIIGVSSFATSPLSKLLNVDKHKQSIIYNGVDGIFFKANTPIKRKLREKYKFNDNEKLILFAGKLTERKGLNDLLVAFEALLARRSDIRLVLAGNGMHSKVLKLIKKYWSKISFTGSLDKKILRDFYKMADIGIVPSYVELCGYTAIEMMYSGLPIIISDVDGLTEIVPDDCGLKVPLILGKKKAYLDQKVLEEKILYFLDNPESAKEYATRALKHAKANLNAKLMVEKTVAVYKKLVNENLQASKKNHLQITEDNSLISVVLPCYNGSDYLKECIDSILAQSYSKWELIIIDDGSVDDSEAIIKNYRDSRIIYIKNEKNFGIVVSLNKGILLAKGKYIARIDADDVMDKNRLLKQVNFLEANSEYVMVGCNQFVIDSTGRPISLLQYPDDDSKIKALLFFGNPFCHSSVMIKSGMLKRFKYFTKYKYCEDYHLWFKTIKSGRMYNIPEFLGSYRVHKGSISNQNKKEMQLYALELISDQLGKLGLQYTTEELAIHGAIYLGYGKTYFNTPEKIKAGKQWITKVLNQINKSDDHQKIFVAKICKLVFSNYCGIE